MRQLRVAFARLTGMFRGQAADSELNEEMQAHLEMEIADNIQRGMKPEEARRAALMATGGLTQAQDAVHDQRSLPWVESIAMDIRYAFRALSRTPGFTAIVVITLALGIGANTAIFSVVRGVLLKPLPHRNGDRLVYLRQSTDGADAGNINFSVPEVRELRAGAPSLGGGLAEYSTWFGVLQHEDMAERLDMGLVTGNFFDVMGLSPILGRLTRPSDDGPGVPPVMVLTHDYWMKRFGGDSSIVGRQLRLDGTSVTVIGVLQPAPFFPAKMDVLLNMVASPHHLSAQMVEARSHRMTEIVARLAPGATVTQARSEVAAVYQRMQNDHKEAYEPGRNYRVAVLPFKEVLGERARVTLWLLMGAAAFVMIISAANVTNLTLMRGVRREHEIVVRAALGAGVRRLRRLLLVENLVLALMGAGLGVAIAVGGVGLLRSFAERYSPRANEIRLDGVVLTFALVLSIAIALMLSFVAWLPKEGMFAAWISAGARRVSGSMRKQRLQRGLVVAQIAVSVVLLAGAFLLTRTMIQLSDVDTGLKTEEVLTIPVQLMNPTRMSPAADVTNKEVYGRMQREIRRLPGVMEVGLGSTMPLSTTGLEFDIKVDGRAVTAGESAPHADFRTASPEYFRAAGIPLLQGREFTDADRAGGEKVVIINRTLADRMFPGASAIGKRIAFTGDVLQFTPISGDWRTVIGVAGNTQDGGLDAEPRLAVFSPFAQEWAIFGGLVIRAENASAVVSSATRIVREMAPGVPIENVLTVAQIKDKSVAPRRLNAALISMFGILAVIIAAVGIAAVLAFSVSARTNEIGIRMSLGADSVRVQRMILGEGGELLAIGLVLGLTGAYFAARVIRGMLFGVAPHDPTTFIGVAALMAVIGLTACWIPALRAARIDPASTMRN